MKKMKIKILEGRQRKLELNIWQSGKNKEKKWIIKKFHCFQKEKKEGKVFPGRCRWIGIEENERQISLFTKLYEYSLGLFFFFFVISKSSHDEMNHSVLWSKIKKMHRNLNRSFPFEWNCVKIRQTKRGIKVSNWREKFSVSAFKFIFFLSFSLWSMKKESKKEKKDSKKMKTKRNLDLLDGFRESKNWKCDDVDSALLMRSHLQSFFLIPFPFVFFLLLWKLCHFD